MGSHNWTQQCQYCGFEEMIVSTYGNFQFEVACPICGYEKWTEEKVPDNSDVGVAKSKLIKMGTQEKQRAIERYYEEKISLIGRLKGDKNKGKQNYME